MKLHLIGIGGTGMGALAGLLKASGHEVRGSDGPIYPPMCDQLAALKIPVFNGYAADNLSWEPDSCVVGNTCPRDNPEVVAAEEAGLQLTSLPKLLGEELVADKHSVVVSGTHGKTTTASLMSHILMSAGRDPSIFIGGVPLDLGRGWRLGAGKEFVLEGDEYDSAFFDKGSKFLHYRPRSAILTSVELDHVDIFSSMEEVRETFRKFVGLIPTDGLLLVAAGSAEALTIAQTAQCTVERYVASSENEVDSSSEIEWTACNIDYLSSGRCSFDLYHEEALFDHFETVMTGDHNVENITACIAIAFSLGLERSEIRQAVASFSGVVRRQQFRGLAQGVTIIDDYGHHPTAIAKTLLGLHRQYPGRRLVALYEPRTATSRRKTFQREFVDSFANADELVVGDIFAPERIPKEDRFDPERLALEVHQQGTPATWIPDSDKIVDHIVQSARPGDVVVVFSSGSFDDIHRKLLEALGDPIIPAARKHVDSIRSLLTEMNLDSQDINEDKVSQFLALENENGLGGCVGLEVFGEDAVLRSLAVAPAGRGRGYGWMLADMAIGRARHRGVRCLYLVTERASDFFAVKHGFRRVDLSTVPKTVSDSITFRCRSENLVPMRLDL